MRLIRLKLGTAFRSLAAGFEIDFLREWDYDQRFEFHPYCLVGRNGSGKTNVLEALAAIFYHVECIHLETQPPGFEFDSETNLQGFRAEKSTPDAFELEYFFPNTGRLSYTPTLTGDACATFHIRIAKQSGEAPVIHRLDRLDTGETTEVELTRLEVKAILPVHVLAYSSGHNEILSLPFIKMRFIHFDEYRDRLLRELDFGRPEGRMIYLDEQYSQAILLCHFLFPSPAVTKVFEDKIGLKGIRHFRLIIRRLRISADHLQQSVSTEPRNVEPTDITAKLSDLIDKLTKCATTYHEDTTPYEDSESYDLYLDYWMTEETRKAFQFHFNEPGESHDLTMASSALGLFQSLQTLLTLNYYLVNEQTKAELYRSSSLYLNETIALPASHERIMRFKDFEVIKDNVFDPLYSKALSDGEHQLVHTVGLCLLFRHEHALFLLDEPETHLNPDWRASYISTLRAALEADEATKGVMREVLLTSHSPFIISDCQTDYVLIFEKDGDGRVKWRLPDFNTFGASANAITMRVFGRKETIGDYSLDVLTGLRRKLDEGISPTKLIDDANAELGDSVEKTLFINQALNRERDGG
jgi:restriction system-associated AAA family ATPase